MLFDSKELKELVDLISQKADEAWEKLSNKSSLSDLEEDTHNETKCEKSEAQDNDENKSYFFKRYDRYVDGQCVDHSVEEYKNGKCVRSEGFNNKIETDEPKLCFQDHECKCDCNKGKESEPTVKYDYKMLEAKLKELQAKNYELEKKLKDADDKLKIINNILTQQ